MLLDDGRCNVMAEENYALAEARKNGHAEVVTMIEEHLAKSEKGTNGKRKHKHRHSRHRSNKGNASDSAADLSHSAPVPSRARRNTLNVPRSESADEELAYGSSSPSTQRRDRRSLMQQAKHAQQLRPKSEVRVVRTQR